MKLTMTHVEFQLHEDVVKMSLSEELGVVEEYVSLYIVRNFGPGHGRRRLNQLKIDVTVNTYDESITIEIMKSEDFRRNLGHRISQHTGLIVEVSDITNPTIYDPYVNSS